MSRINLVENFSNTLSQNLSRNAVASNISLTNNNEFLFWLRKKTSSQNFIAYSLVVLLHIAAPLCLMLNLKNNSNLPTISFTVTMLDVSATSSNAVSSSASVANNSKAVTKNDFKEKNSQTKASATTSEATQNNKAESKSPQSHDSAQRNAVLAPTAPALFDAAYLNNPAPTYPALSRRFEEQGTVILNVYVDENGKAQNISVKKSSGFARLDESALETVKKWQFIAAKQGDKLIASWAQVPIKFVLEK